MTEPAPTGTETTAVAGPEPDTPLPAFSLKAYIRTTVLQLVVIFVLYTLSIGPMFWRWYDSKYLNGPEYIARFYYPLYLMSAFKPFGEFLNWYVDLWIS